jgi:hypothetical protein
MKIAYERCSGMEIGREIDGLEFEPRENFSGKFEI